MLRKVLRFLSPDNTVSAQPNLNNEDSIYDAVFFCACFANVFMLISVSLLFRYADFVSSLGGTEWHLGWIVGLGAVGAIFFRIVQGVAIDRFGPLIVWILSLIGLIIANLLHVGIDQVDGWAIYAVRLMLNLCICLLYTSPSPRDRTRSRMPSSA